MAESWPSGDCATQSSDDSSGDDIDDHCHRYHSSTKSTYALGFTAKEAKHFARQAHHALYIGLYIQ